jgi:hypothetical protein
MSYRHSSYRKLSKILMRVNGMPAADAAQAVSPAEMARVVHWSNLAPHPKPPGWGKPKSQRAA